MPTNTKTRARKSPKKPAASRRCAAAAGSRFVWRGDLTDDCSCKVGNLLAHCENLGPLKWRWASDKSAQEVDVWFVSVGPVNRRSFASGDCIFHSGEPGGFIVGGEMARAIAEAILSANVPVRREPDNPNQ